MFKREDKRAEKFEELEDRTLMRFTIFLPDFLSNLLKSIMKFHLKNFCIFDMITLKKFRLDNKFTIIEEGIE